MTTQDLIELSRPVTSAAATVRAHEVMYGDYRVLIMHAPEVASRARPGQFIHLKIPGLEASLLRRPFSIFKSDADTVSILYKPVGRGTEAMVRIVEGETLSILGPLGTGFPVERAVERPVLVAGGYGMAALYMVARDLDRRGIIFMGGRSAADILCVDEFEAIGWDVCIATNDGSLGTRGFVTEPLDAHLADAGTDGVEFFACGPNAMLRAVGERAESLNVTAWLSMDRNMGCGVGACLVCVQRVRPEGGPPDAWEWARVCTEGPVFEASRVVWE